MALETKRLWIIEKINVLLKDMEETYDLDPKLKEDFIWPENYLEVLSTRDKTIKYNECNKDDLIKLNYYFREISMMKKNLKSGIKQTYEEYVEWKIVDILTNENEETPIQVAIYYVHANVVKKDGHLLTIEESAEFVEQIRNKHNIKKK